MVRLKTAAVLLVVLALAGCTAPSPTPEPTAPDASERTDGGSVCPGGTTAAGDFCLADDPVGSDLAAAVADVFAAQELRAVIAGVWKDGEPVMVGAMGDSITGVPATIDMHHILGNWGTPMLATVLLQQVDAGVLGLDDPISKWYPDLPSSDQVTLQMLIRSTSGYSHYTVDEDFVTQEGADPFQHWDPDAIIAIGAEGGPAFPPGTSFRFSDTNFIILASIIEMETGSTMGELMRTGIWEPLGMTGMTTPDTAVKTDPVLHGYGDPRGIWEDVTDWDPSWTWYAGGVAGNQDALRRFIDAVASGELVSQESHDEQLAPLTIGLGTMTEDKYYVMGNTVVDGWLFNNPGLPGYLGAAGTLPGEGWTIVVYTVPSPTSPGSPAATDIFEELSAIVAPEQPLTYD